MKNHVGANTGIFKASSRLAVFVGLMAAGIAFASEPLDTRQVIQLNDAQRAHVLGEMRTMLSGTQRILAALAADDMAEAARQARLLGMANKHNAENTVHDALPTDFMRMGMTLHRAFDEIAANVQAGANGAQTLAQLSQVMMSCNNCHEIFQIQRFADAQPNRSADRN